jgi:hypothetical protein
MSYSDKATLRMKISLCLVRSRMWRYWCPSYEDVLMIYGFCPMMTLAPNCFWQRILGLAFVSIRSRNTALWRNSVKLVMCLSEGMVKTAAALPQELQEVRSFLRPHSAERNITWRFTVLLWFCCCFRREKIISKCLCRLFVLIMLSYFCPSETQPLILSFFYALSSPLV